MENTTDTAAPDAPMTDEQAVEWLLEPEQSDEPEAEADEAPAEPTEPEEADADTDDAVEPADDADDEADDAGDDEEPDADDDEQPNEELYDVKSDGIPDRVTLDELKRGYAGQKSIQRGLEENAATRKQLQQASGALQQERQALLQMYQQASQTGFLPPPQAPSMELMRSDPIAYMEAKAYYEQDLAAYQQQQQEIQFQTKRQQQIQQAERQRLVKEQYAKLVEKLPEFGDPEKGPKVRERIVSEAVREYNFDAKDLELVADARVVVALNDALEYRRLQKGKKAARQPRDAATAVTKPSGKRRDGGKRARADKAKQQAMKTQSDDDWVNFLLS